MVFQVTFQVTTVYQTFVIQVAPFKFLSPGFFSCFKFIVITAIKSFACTKTHVIYQFPVHWTSDDVNKLITLPEHMVGGG